LGTCNATFKSLSKGRTFAQIWNDPDILINFWPGTNHSLLGTAAEANDAQTGKLNKLITISERAFRKSNPVLVVAGTLVHELAHHAGASDSTSDAEDTLDDCGFSDISQPGLIGQLMPHDMRIFFEA
jgi:hypothetical protein